jgi:hypothetical protein
MDNEFIQGNTSKSVSILNSNDEIINVSWYIDNPTLDLIREDRTMIPNSAWVSIEPEWQIIQPFGNALFYIYLDIPNSQNNCNQHWEIWPTFKQEETQIFNWEHTLRLYIDTPEEFNVDTNKDSLFSLSIENIVLISIIIIVVLMSLFVISKKKIKKS